MDYGGTGKDVNYWDARTTERSFQRWRRANERNEQVCEWSYTNGDHGSIKKEGVDGGEWHANFLFVDFKKKRCRM